MYTITLTEGALKRYKRYRGRDAICNKYSITLSEGMEAMRSKAYIYCLSCSQKLYVDSTIDVTDEEQENFFFSPNDSGLEK